MPELPEVESLRGALDRRLRGARITEVEVRRRDIIHGNPTRPALLCGRRINGFHRHGKQLAMVGAGPAGSTSPCVCFHLGMSGTVILRSRDDAHAPLPHTHVIWYLDGGRAVHYRDPRRFGGLWTFRDRQRLQDVRWNALGPDALTVHPTQLHARLGRTRRALKAALLDQAYVAGLGNIYVDELPHRCRLHPMTPADDLPLEQVRDLVRKMRRLLRSAVQAGGSTLRDHRDATGLPGRFQAGHRVYGRGGDACLRCRTTLSTIQVASRTTVYCPLCQGEHGPLRAARG